MSNLTASSCPIEGNADLYGLGIRMGIYIQMLTVQLSGILSSYFAVEDHIGQGTVVFVLATAIALVRVIKASVNGGSGGEYGRPVEPVEVFPLVTLLLLQVSVCRVSPANRTTLLMWTAELVGITALFGWFWWYGMDMMPTSCPRDHDRAFFFASVGIWGWYRTFNKVSSVMAATAASLTVVFYIGGFIVLAVGFLIPFLRRKKGQESSIASNSDPAQQPKQTLPISLDLIVNIGAIVYVEMAIRWNQISGVHSLNSPGQFMPFIIALGQLFSVFFSAAKYLLQQPHQSEVLYDGDQGSTQCRHHKDNNDATNKSTDIALTSLA